jgi:rhodanese-related sulfurtransferase
VIKLLAALQEVAQHNVAEVTQLVNTYLTSKDSLEPLSVNDLVDRMRSGLVTVVDVRPKEEYAAGHLLGAINVPLAEIEKNLTKLPRDREIIAYCRGPFCVLSFEAVARLRSEGLKARRLETGFPEWKVAGLPVE